MSTPKHKKQLIEEIGLRIEERLSLSPLAARVYALLTLSSYDGLTFEEIRKTIEASKSSTSVNLNVLTQLGYVDYYTKPGDRKRYFKVAKYFQLQSLELYHKSLENDIEMVDKVNAYNKVNHPEKFIDEKSLGDISQAYMRQMQRLVEKTIGGISRFREREK